MERQSLESVELGPGRLLLALFLAVLPSVLKTTAYKMAGAKLGKHVSIGFGSFVLANSFSRISIGDYSQIRQFTLIICSEVSIGSYTEIAMFVWIWGAGRLKVGDRCYIGPRCIINLRRNDFEMGEYAGLGPGSVAYTHGQWLPYTEGWPRTYGDIVLGAYSWVPARVFLSPGVRVGSRSIVGSGAVVTKNIPPFSFAAGVPARVIGSTERIKKTVDQDELLRRAMEIAADLPNFFSVKSKTMNLACGLEAVEVERKSFMRTRRWHILVCKPEQLGSITEAKLDPGRLVLFSTGPLRKELRESCFAWFDFGNLECSDLSESFAFDIWNFLRRTWCVTCRIATEVKR